MPEAHVVGGDGEPGAVGLGNAPGELGAHLGEIARAREDALLGVAAVLDAHGVGRVGGEHHHPDGAVAGFGARIPFRLLVADRRQQAPVGAPLRGRLLEPGTVSGQPVADVGLELARFHVGKAARVAGGLLYEPRQCARGLQVMKESVDAREQIRRPVPHQPLHRARFRQRKAHPHVGIQMMREGEFTRVGDGVIRAAGVDVLHRVGGARGGFHPLQGGRDGLLQALQDALLRTAGAHREFRRFQLQRRPRLHAAALVEHQLRDARVGLGRIACAAPVGRVGERGRGDIGAAGGEFRLHRALIGERGHHEVHAEARGVGTRQLVLQPLGALRAQVVTGRQIERDDAQLAARADRIKGGCKSRAARE